MKVLSLLGSVLGSVPRASVLPEEHPPLPLLTPGAVLVRGLPGVTADQFQVLDLQRDDGAGLIYTGACYGLEGDTVEKPNLLTQIGHSLGELSGRMQSAGSDVSGAGVMVMGVTDIEAYRRLYETRSSGLGALWKKHMRGHFPAMGVIGLPRLPETDSQVGIFSIGVPRNSDGTYPLALSGGGKGYRDVATMGGAIFSGGIVGWDDPPSGPGVPAPFPERLCDQMGLAFANINDAFDLADENVGLADTRLMLMFVTEPAYAEFSALVATGDLELLWMTLAVEEQSMPPLIVVGATALVEPRAKIEIFAVA